MEKLKKAGLKARWYVLGEGPERSNLEKQIEQAGLTEDFLLLGAVDNPYPYFAQTDLYVHATMFEGKSIAIQEAQTLGCAIVASDSNEEQITDGVDGFVRPLKPEALAKAILQLAGNAKMRETFGKAAMQHTVTYEEDKKLLDNLLR